MKVLVVGSGGREHSIVWKLTQSKRVSQIYCIPGNPGIAKIAECIDIANDINAICEFALENAVDLTIVNSGALIKKGIVNIFRENNLLIFGPTKEAASIESDSTFIKTLLSEYNIPSRKSAIFDKETLALNYIKKAKFPLIIKYESEEGSRGEFLCETDEQAKKVIKIGFESLYKAVVIEDFIAGKDVSMHFVSDGYNIVPLSPCKEYNMLYDGNTGPLTDGMGAYAPVGFIGYELEQKIAHNILFPLLDGLNAKEKPFTGILNIKLIVDKYNNPYVVSFKSQLSDTAAQTILPLLDDDLFEIMYSVATGSFSDEYEFFSISNSSAVTVNLVSQGYPLNVKKQNVIEGLDSIDDDDVYVFQAGTLINQYGELVSYGGNVMSLTAVGATLHRAYEKVYDAVGLVKFKEMKYRKDIAKSLIIEKNNFL